MPSDSEIRCRLDSLLRALWIVAASVMALGILREIALPIIGPDTALRDLRHISFDAEHSLPAWYETLAMASASALLAVCALLSRHADKENTTHWAVLSVIFILLSLDEAIAIHEVTMAPLRGAFGFDGVLYFAWVVLAAPLLLLVGAFFVPFLLRLPSRFGLSFTMAALIFVSGAFGLEFVGGYLVSHGGWDYLPYRIEVIAEECLEVIGITLFLSELATLLVQRSPVLTVRFNSAI